MKRRSVIDTTAPLLITAEALNKLERLFADVKGFNEEHVEREMAAYSSVVETEVKEYEQTLRSSTGEDYSNDQITEMLHSYKTKLLDNERDRKTSSLEDLDLRVTTGKGGSFACDTFDDLDKIANSKSDPITDLSISTASTVWLPFSAGIAFTSSTWRAPCEVTLEGDHDHVTIFERRFQEFVDSLKTTYGPLRSFIDNPFVEGSLYVLTTLFLLVALGTVIFGFAPTALSENEKFFAVTLSGIVIGSPILAGILLTTLGRLIKFLYPKIVFSVNEGVKSYEKILYWRKVLHAGLMLPLAVSAISAFLFR